MATPHEKSWQGFETHDGKAAVVKCPGCQLWQHVSEDQVDADGRMKATMDCPTTGAKYAVRLVGWAEEAT